MKTATDMGIAVYTIGGPCTEEVADTTMCHILNLYRRVSHLNEAVKSGRIFLSICMKTRKIPVITSIFKVKSHRMRNKFVMWPMVACESAAINLELLD